MTPGPGDKRSKPPKLQDTVRLSAMGNAKMLGDLESRVMSAVWDLARPVPARQVHERVVQEHDVALLTVITVLNKLVAKRLVARTKQDNLLHFSATMSEAEFQTHVSRRMVEGILALSPDAVTASLVDVLSERHPEQLAELGRLIRRRLARRAPDDGER